MSKQFAGTPHTYQCYHCEEEITFSRLSHDTKRAAKASGRSVGTLDPEDIVCIDCANVRDDSEGWDLLCGHNSDVWKWNLSGLSLTPGQRVVIALNY